MERQMIGNYHKWHAGQLWTRSTSVQWTQRICRRNGRTRSIRCTGYHDLSMSCLTVREPTNSTEWIEEQAEDRRRRDALNPS